MLFAQNGATTSSLTGQAFLKINNNNNNNGHNHNNDNNDDNNIHNKNKRNYTNTVLKIRYSCTVPRRNLF